MFVILFNFFLLKCGQFDEQVTVLKIGETVKVKYMKL